MSLIPSRIKPAPKSRRAPIAPLTRLLAVCWAVSTVAVNTPAVPKMSAADLTIDHVTVAGQNLEAMRAALKAVGIRTEYGGPHNNHATEMALASFHDGSYLELIAIQPNADPAAVNAHPWSKALKNNGGPCAFAVRASDIGREAARLKAAGFDLSQPERAGRTRPDGVKIEWETADIRSGPRGSFFPFLIQDITPRVSRAYPTGKLTTEKYRGVSKVILGVKDLDAAIAKYRRAYSLPEPRRQEDSEWKANLAYFEGTPIILAQPLTSDSWLSRRLSEYGDGPCAFVLLAKGGISAENVSRWFGGYISWFDSARLVWRLGMEPSK